MSGQRVFAEMGEWKSRLHLFERPQDGAVRDPAEREHYRADRQLRDFLAQVTVAGFDFERGRAVGRRQALDRVGNATIDEARAIIAARRCGMAGKAESMQAIKQELAGRIAAERDAGCVRAMQSGSEPDDQQTRVGRPRSGNRTTVVIRIAALLFSAVVSQSRTELAVAKYGHRLLGLGKLDHALFDRDLDQIDLVLRAEFFQQTQAIGANRFRAEAQLLGNFRVG